MTSTSRLLYLVRFVQVNSPRIYLHSPHVESFVSLRVLLLEVAQPITRPRLVSDGSLTFSEVLLQLQLAR